jgi:hypothetical protein
VRLTCVGFTGANAGLEVFESEARQVQSFGNLHRVLLFPFEHQIFGRVAVCEKKRKEKKMKRLKDI